MKKPTDEMKKIQKELFSFPGVNEVGWRNNLTSLYIGFRTKEDHDSFNVTEYKGFKVEKDGWGKIIPFRGNSA